MTKRIIFSIFLSVFLCAPAAQSAELEFPSVAGLETGDLIKSPDSSTVYYFGQDEMRYGFPNESTYFSWYDDFSAVKTITATEMATIPLGDMVTYLCDTVAIKTPATPTVYAVLPFEYLIPFANEEEAVEMFGEDWQSLVVNVPEEYIGLYTMIDSQDTDAVVDYFFGIVIREFLRLSFDLDISVIDENGNIDSASFDEVEWYTIDVQERTRPVTGVMIYDDPHRFAFSDETEDCGMASCYYSKGTIESGSTIKFVNYTNETLSIRETDNLWTTGLMDPGEISVVEINIEPRQYDFSADQDDTLFGSLIVE